MIFEIISVKNIRISEHCITCNEHSAFPEMVYVVKEHDAYTLIYGKKVFEHAMIQNISVLPAVIFPEISVETLKMIFKKIVPTDNVFIELALIESAHYFNISDDEIIDELIPVFHTCPHKPLQYNEYMFLKNIPEHIRSARLNVACIILMNTCDEDLKTALFTLFLEKNVSRSNQLKLCRIVLALLTHISNDEIISMISETDDFSSLYSHMYALLHPEMTEMQQSFDDIIQKARLPKNIHVHPPKFFEGCEYHFSFQAKNANELKEAAKKLLWLADNTGDDTWLP